MNSEQRSEFRAFVREHHPDRGGDPDVFIAGMARFTAAPPPPPPRERSYDAPIEVVGRAPLPVRVGVAIIRTWHRRRHPRVR